MNADTIAQDFFDAYSHALIARDVDAVSRLYATPALILFPGQSIAVSEPSQTADFFLQAWEQYDGIKHTTTDINVLAQTQHSLWADVTWHHDNDTTERMMYQLVESEDGWKIAVLTALDE